MFGDLEVGSLVYNIHNGDLGKIIKIQKHYTTYIVQMLGQSDCISTQIDDLKEYIYQPGDRVRIISPVSKYNGCSATIYKELCAYNKNGKVYLYIDGTHYQPNTIMYDKNGKLKNYYFQLIKSSVEPLFNNIHHKEREDNNMAKLTGFKRVAVIEQSGNNYHYALYDDDINVGDDVLVTSNNNIHKVKEIITVDEAKERFNKDIISEVKCKVDLTAFNQRLKNREEAAKLRTKMDEEIKKMDEINKYQMYAENNPELAEMLKQYRELVE